MADLTTFYRDLLTEHPTMGDLGAVAAAIDLFGRGFNSPTIAEHRQALADARTPTQPPAAKRYWLSWWTEPDPGQFELHTPWWISGARAGNAHSVCAAITATSEDAAREKITDSYDVPPASGLEWRFVDERPADWSPYCDRFERADWMQWPDTTPNG